MNQNKTRKYDVKATLISSLKTAFDPKNQKPVHNFHILFQNVQLQMTRKNKLFKKTLKNRKFSQEYSRIINEEYKLASSNEQTNFVMLYRRNPDVAMDDYFKEGREPPREVPSFVITKMFHFCIGFLFFLKFLNNVLN